MMSCANNLNRVQRLNSAWLFRSVRPPNLFPPEHSRPDTGYLGMSIFDKVPDEIISRIITIGCDVAAWSEVQPNTLQKSKKPIPYPFAVNSRAVCQRWHAIVHTRSNAHMWCILADLAHPDTHDERSTLARFQSRLSSSSGCDIYVNYQTVAMEEHTISSDSFEIRTLVLVMKLIKPYRMHVAALRFQLRSNMTRIIVAQLVRDLGFCPRLHSIYIACNTENDAGLLDEQGELDHITSSALALHWPDVDGLSTLSGEAEKTRHSSWSKPDKVWFRLFRTNIDDQAWSFIHSQLQSITIEGKITLSWSNFEQLMMGCPLLRNLDISISCDIPASVINAANTIPVIEHQLDSLRLGLQDSKLVSRILTAFRLPSLTELTIRIWHGSLSDQVRFHNLPDIAYAGVPNSTIETSSKAGLIPSLRSLSYNGIDLQDWEPLHRAIGAGPPIERLHLYLKEDPERRSTQHQQHPSSEPLYRTSVLAELVIHGSNARLFATLYALNLQGTTRLEFHVLGSEDLIDHLEGPVLYIPALAKVDVRVDLMGRAMQLIRHLVAHVHSATTWTEFQALPYRDFAFATLSFISVGANDPNSLRPQMQLSKLGFTIYDSRSSIFDYRDSFWSSPVIVDVTGVLITLVRPSNLITELAHGFQIFTGSSRAVVPFPFLQRLEFRINSRGNKSTSVRTVLSERCTSFFNAMAAARLRQNAPLARFRIYVDGEKYVNMVRDANSGLLIQSSLEDDDTDEGESEYGSTDEDIRRTVLEAEEEIDDEEQAKPMLSGSTTN
jgi:hypothetical protein